MLTDFQTSTNTEEHQAMRLECSGSERDAFGEIHRTENNHEKYQKTRKLNRTIEHKTLD